MYICILTYVHTHKWWVGARIGSFWSKLNCSSQWKNRYIYTYIHVYMCTYSYTLMCVYMCIYIHTYIHVSIYIYVYILYIFTYSHAYTYICIHIHICMYPYIRYICAGIGNRMGSIWSEPNCSPQLSPWRLWSVRFD